MGEGGGGFGHRRIYKNVIGLRIDEKVGNHCHTGTIPFLLEKLIDK